MHVAQKTAKALITQRTHKPDQVWRLRLTIVFHPQWQRIGHFVDLLHLEQHCHLPRSLNVGRLEPAFNDGLPLLEPHVSRSALNITLGPPNPEMLESMLGAVPALRLAIPQGASGYISQQELNSCIVDPDQLIRGVPIRLGHGVVCLLRVTLKGDDGLSSAACPDVNGELLGTSPETEQLRHDLQLAGMTTLPCLLLGESGVGKEVAARFLHRASSRAAQSMVSVNMAVVPESLAGPELFGCVKGAYTGAEARNGYVRDANGSSLFLDEIADAPESVQAQLLRTIQEGEVQVVGGGIKRVDVRFIAATDALLEGRDSAFRHALLTRLSGHRIRITPLRERLEDVGPQAANWLLEHDTLPTQPHPFIRVQDSPVTAAHWGRFFFDLLNRDFPGNSRELHQLVLRAAMGDTALLPVVNRQVVSTVANQTPERAQPIAPSRSAVTDAELAEAFKAHDYELQATAVALGMSRPTLRRRVEAHPDLVLIHEISDSDIREAASIHADLPNIARRLGVSRHALRPRLRQLGLL